MLIQAKIKENAYYSHKPHFGLQNYRLLLVFAIVSHHPSLFRSISKQNVVCIVQYIACTISMPAKQITIQTFAILHSSILMEFRTFVVYAQ